MPRGPILVVDDEPVNLALMRQVLGGQYRLVFANGGRQALAAAHKHEPSLILLDVHMPELDGYAVCRALKANPRTEAIPVIFVSTLSDVGDEAAGFEAGGVDYITKPVSVPVVLARVRTHLSLVRTTRLERSWRDAIAMLGAACHFNDNGTGSHIWRMAAYSAAVAAACGWSPEQCVELEMAAPMHDAGKLGIPSEILRKPGPLDDAEWAVMKSHTRIGHDILAASGVPVFRLAAEVALNHHEKWDGSGYPEGLAGESIPESARIVALCDVFDALSVVRSYKDAWPLERVLEKLQGDAGTHFEPRLVQVFLSILPRILEIKAFWDGEEKRRC